MSTRTTGRRQAAAALGLLAGLLAVLAVLGRRQPEPRGPEAPVVVRDVPVDGN